MPDFDLYEAQGAYFLESSAKYRIMHKGRRVGFTQGAAIYLIIESIRCPGIRSLWVDTIYSNIDRYVERCFIPAMRSQRIKYEWRQQKKELCIGESSIDFRSADRAENIEGFSYNRFLLNEAGIILKGDKGRYLWSNALVPMIADYEDAIVFVGGTPKGRSDRDGGNALFYDLAMRGYSGDPRYETHCIETEKNPFLSREGVAEVKAELPTGPVRDQELHGKFIDVGAGIIKKDWLQVVDRPIEGKRVRSWDLGVTIKESSDWSAGALVVRGEGNAMQVRDMQHIKEQWPDLRKRIVCTAMQDGPDTMIVLEQAGQQVALIDDLRRIPEMAGFHIRQAKPKGDKLARAMPWVAHAEGGRVSIMRGAWNKDFLEECACFTADDSHRHDDQIDAVSQAWTQLARMNVRQTANFLA